jgi:hypothetical protein
LSAVCSAAEGIDGRQLVMAIDVIRHGDRGPIREVAGLVGKSWLASELGHLTKLGIENSYKLGVKLRQYYIDQTHLLDPNRLDTQVSFISTNMPRTIGTAKQIAKGMLGDDVDIRPDIIPSNSVRDSEGKKIDHFANLSDKQKVKVGMLIHYINKRMNVHISSPVELARVGWLLFINRIHNKPFPEDHISKAKADEIIGAARTLYLHKTSGKKFACGTGKHFLSYVNDRFGKKIDGIEQLKLILLTAHDSNISGIVKVLGLASVYPNYNADLRFELYKKANDYSVKVSLNGVALRVCGTEYCRYDEFSRTVSNRVAMCG